MLTIDFSINKSTSESGNMRGDAEEELRRENCKYWRLHKCEAPMCPMYEEISSYAMWEPDDEICPLRKFTSLLYIKNQNRIKKKEKKCQKNKTLYATNL